tara:strand:- start:213 stop:692 length:480 start_codon:yes stop_codon:yes gene_type:complete
MPQMGLGMSSGKSKNRTPSVAFQSDFGSGSHGFTANNATIDGNYTHGIPASQHPAMKVDTTSSNGYAYKEFTVIPNTKYTWRIKLQAGEIGSGDKSYAWGTSADDGTNVTETVQNVPGVTSRGTFATGGSQTSCFLTLKVANSGKFAAWDNILLETLDG